MLPEAQKAIQELPGNVRQAMWQILERLIAWPEVSGVRSLFGKGYAANKFRMKTWDWRIEFLVDMPNRTITVTRIGHRDSFYDEYH
jgi:mRNA-degrading endonuclease RelE of RelBE toxin-antitoxin system